MQVEDIPLSSSVGIDFKLTPILGKIHMES